MNAMKTMKELFFDRGLTVILILICFSQITNAQQVYEFPFKNPGLSIEERVNDLVGRMTVDEKISQMMNGAPAIDRLGIPAYNWWNECLHGVARMRPTSKAGCATVFPQAIGMAASGVLALVG